MAEIAVTGASGKVGGRVVDLLSRSRLSEVIAVARRPLDFGISGVRTAIAAYEDREALRSAFSGADTLVLITSDGDATTVNEHHWNIVTAATEAGISNVVALGGIDADQMSPFCYSKVHAALERMLAEQRFNVSIVRASIFAEFFVQWIADARRSGEIRLPASDGKISLVGRDDVAAALASLAAKPLRGIHNITGPESLDCDEIALVARDRYGIPLKFTNITAQEHLVEMAQAGIDPWWMYAYSSMFQAIREQRWSLVSPDLTKLTGDSPKAFSLILQ